MIRKLLALAGVIILSTFPVSAVSMVLATSENALQFDLTVNLPVIVTITMATGSFIFLSLKNQWRTEAISKRVGRHDELLDHAAKALAAATKDLALMQQSVGQWAEVVKQHGSTLDLVARQDERMLAMGREIGELRTRVRELESNV